jgi:hypothetical protein
MSYCQLSARHVCHCSVMVACLMFRDVLCFPSFPYETRHFMTPIKTPVQRVLGALDPGAIVRLEGLGKLKISISSLGIEPITFHLQHSA